MEQVARRNRQWTVRVRWKILFVLLGAAGVALRVWVHRSALGIPDSDEAVVGLMVDHAMRGEPTTFFWGQAYGGSQEALLTVPVFWIAGSSWLTLRLVPIALSVVAAVVVWRVGRRTIGEPAAGVAGGLAWIWPPFVIYKLTHQWGFYASGTLYSALVLLLTLRLAERPSKARAGTFGLVVGLALWQSAQLVPIVVTAIVWAVWRRRSVLRYAWIAAVFAVIGALPSIVWNVRNDWGSFMSPIEDTTTYLHRLRVFASPLLPMLLGLRTPFTQERLLPAIPTLLLYAAIAALLAFGCFRARHHNASLLYVVALAFPFVYTLAPATFFSPEPKYLVVLSPVVVLLVAQLATTYWRATAVVAVALAVSIAHLEQDGDLLPHGASPTPRGAAGPRPTDLDARPTRARSRVRRLLACLLAHLRHAGAHHRFAEQVHEADLRRRPGGRITPSVHPVSAVRAEG